MDEYAIIKQRGKYSIIPRFGGEVIKIERQGADKKEIYPAQNLSLQELSLAMRALYVQKINLPLPVHHNPDNLSTRFGVRFYCDRTGNEKDQGLIALLNIDNAVEQIFEKLHHVNQLIKIKQDIIDRAKSILS